MPLRLQEDLPWLYREQRMSYGISADVVSLTSKTIDYAVYDGSGEEVTNQAIRVGVSFGSGAVVKGLTNAICAKVITRTGSRVAGPVFRSSMSGRFVSNSFGYTVETVKDATRISTTIMATELITNKLTK